MEHNQIRISLKWIQKRNIDYCISLQKKKVLQNSTVLAVVERLFWQLGTHFSDRCRYREVAVVERFKQELKKNQGLNKTKKKWPL